MSGSPQVSLSVSRGVFWGYVIEVSEAQETLQGLGVLGVQGFRGLGFSDTHVRMGLSDLTMW